MLLMQKASRPYACLVHGVLVAMIAAGGNRLCAEAVNAASGRFHIAGTLCKQGRLKEAIQTLKESFERGYPRPCDVLRFPEFQPLLRDEESRKSVRELLRAQARESSVTMVTADEPGSALVVAGVVRDTGGKPVPGARLFVFHADDSGRYTPTEAMNEPNSRLFAFLVSDAEGKFEIRTVRPGQYPERKDVAGDAKFIPRHIHFEVGAPGFAGYRCQMIFDDDERVTDHWKQWAKTGRHPIAHVAQGPDGVRRATCDLMLERK